MQNCRHAGMQTCRHAELHACRNVFHAQENEMPSHWFLPFMKEFPLLRVPPYWEFPFLLRVPPYWEFHLPPTGSCPLWRNSPCWEFPLLRVLLTESFLLLRVPPWVSLFKGRNQWAPTGSCPLWRNSPCWEFPLTERSTSLRVPLPWSSTPWEFHPPESGSFSCESSSQGFTELWPPNWVKFHSMHLMHGSRILQKQILREILHPQ